MQFGCYSDVDFPFFAAYRLPIYVGYVHIVCFPSPLSAVPRAPTFRILFILSVSPSLARFLSISLPQKANIRSVLAVDGLCTHSNPFPLIHSLLHVSCSAEYMYIHGTMRFSVELSMYLIVCVCVCVCVSECSDAIYYVYSLHLKFEHGWVTNI